MALRDSARTLGVSLALHGVFGGLILAFAGQRLLRGDSESETVELEILTEPEPIDEPAPDPPEEIVPEIPTEARPEIVPEEVEVKATETPRPFQEEAQEDGQREAEEDALAIPTPTAPLTFSMTETVAGGSGLDYSSTTTGNLPMPPPGPPGGKLGPLANLGASDVKVARDWQVTRQASPVNDRSFEPRYPALAKRQGREATVVLQLDIDVEGKVATAVVLEGPEGHGFRDSALEYARKLRFSPALAGATPVASRLEWSVYFYVRN